MNLRKPLFISAAAFSLASNALAQQTVDTELLLMIDVSGSVSASEYDLMMGGYAAAFRSSSILDAIQAGKEGSIAVGLAFWSGSNEQELAVKWSLIDDKASAESFATSIEGVSRPYRGSTAIGSALSWAPDNFGLETGGPDNGFVSAVQVIDFSGDGTDNNTPTTGFASREAALQAARDGALNVGVDVINGLPIGNSFMNTYYENNVIGGSANGQPAFSELATSFNDFERALGAKLQREITIANGTATPEPSSALLGSLGIGALLLRRRR